MAEAPIGRVLLAELRSMHCSWAAVASGTSHDARLAAPAPQHASAYQNALWRAARNWRSTGRVISYRQLWSILRIEWEVKNQPQLWGIQLEIMNQHINQVGGSKYFMCHSIVPEDDGLFQGG